MVEMVQDVSANFFLNRYVNICTLFIIHKKWLILCRYFSLNYHLINITNHIGILFEDSYFLVSIYIGI